MTDSKRTEYRRALVRAGVPPVYAYMASQRLTSDVSRRSLRNHSGSALLYGGFVWAETDEGHEFWSSIALQACE